MKYLVTTNSFNICEIWQLKDQPIPNGFNFHWTWKVLRMRKLKVLIYSLTLQKPAILKNLHFLVTRKLSINWPMSTTLLMICSSTWITFATLYELIQPRTWKVAWPFFWSTVTKMYIFSNKRLFFLFILRWLLHEGSKITKIWFSKSTFVCQKLV